MYLILTALMIVVSVSLITFSVFAGHAEQEGHMKRRLRDDGARAAVLVAHPDTRSSTGKWFKEQAAPALAKLIKPKSDEEQNRLKVKMANAGLRGEGLLMIFLAAKVIVGAGLGLFAVLGTAGSRLPARSVFGLAGLAGSFGFMLPDLWLHFAAKFRRERITHSLPDCLDLMVICVEAGSGLDAAMQRVNQEMANVHPELAEEFALANMEVQMGITRAEALNNLSIRTGVSEVRSLSALLIQAERFGTSIANALRIHADSLRTRRRQAAEERAAKTAVKLILPLIFFIFPAIFVVLAGPAALRLYETLVKGVFSGRG